MKDMQFELVDDTINDLTRIKLQNFEYIALLVCPKIKLMDTNMKEAITVKERLAITLKFLATSNLYTSLQYLFRVSKSTTFGMISDVWNVFIKMINCIIHDSCNSFFI